MPELPEVETVVRSLAPHLPGRRIVSAAFTSKFVTPGDRDALARHVAGRTIESVKRRGKYIVITLDQGTLVVHLGMTGKLLLDSAGDRLSRDQHTHGWFALDTGVLAYHDPRQFGRILWQSASPEDDPAGEAETGDGSRKRLAKLGPEPLEVSFEDFYARMRKRKTRMKALLLNQGFVSGVGNIYADETLFAARVHPLASSQTLSKPRALLVYQAMREILTMAIEHGGSSISDYVDADGNRGWFQVMHNAYGREGEPCLRCAGELGGRIKKILVGQRGTHYCPKCQKR